jgi:hypothetical protein
VHAPIETAVGRLEGVAVPCRGGVEMPGDGSEIMVSRRGVMGLIGGAAIVLLLGACSAPFYGADSGFEMPSLDRSARASLWSGGEVSLSSAHLPLDCAGREIEGRVKDLSFPLDCSTAEVQATGFARGLGSDADEYFVEFAMFGEAVILCANNGGNLAPGQNVNVEGVSFGGLVEQGSGSGRYVYATEFDAAGDLPDEFFAAVDPKSVCPNGTWKSIVVGFDWTGATVTLFLGSPGDPDAQEEDALVYVCVTTLPNEMTCSLLEEG